MASKLTRQKSTDPRSTEITFDRVQLVREESKVYDCPSSISSPGDANEFISKVFRLQDEPHEIFGVLSLSTKNVVLGARIIYQGFLNSTYVETRDIFQYLLLTNASTFICFHNHPSGDPRPSEDDLAVTRRIEESGKLLDITLLDHIIIGRETYVSLESNRGKRTAVAEPIEPSRVPLVVHQPAHNFRGLSPKEKEAVLNFVGLIKAKRTTLRYSPIRSL